MEALVEQRELVPRYGLNILANAPTLGTVEGEQKHHPSSTRPKHSAHGGSRLRLSCFNCFSISFKDLFFHLLSRPVLLSSSNRFVLAVLSVCESIATYGIKKINAARRRRSEVGRSNSTAGVFVVLRETARAGLRSLTSTSESLHYQSNTRACGQTALPRVQLTL